MKKVLIVYSTVGGNTELVVEKVINELEENKFEAKKIRVDICEIRQAFENDLVILASPTYGQGDIEQHFKPFLKALQNEDITNKEFAVIGLGDTKYYPEYLTESAGLLEDFIKENQGVLISPALRIGMPPLKFIDKLVPGWVTKIINYYSQK